MKTKIKRHSRAVISVILAISMLVSCMMVGLIATDAAKVTDSAVGAKTDDTEEAVGAKDEGETVGLDSGDGMYLGIGSANSMQWYGMGSNEKEIVLDSAKTIYFHFYVGGYKFAMGSTSTQPSEACTEDWILYAQKGASNNISASLPAGTYKFKLKGIQSSNANALEYQFWKVSGGSGGGDDPEPTADYIYFDNSDTKWDNVFAYLYTSSCWNDDKGSGSKNRNTGVEMTYDSALGLYKTSITDSITHVVFLKERQDGYDNFWQTEAAYIELSDTYANNSKFSASTPVYVPDSDKNEQKNSTRYYDTEDTNYGSWVAATNPTAASLSISASPTELTAVGQSSTITVTAADIASGLDNLTYTIYDRDNDRVVGTPQTVTDGSTSVTFTVTPNARVKSYYASVKPTSAAQQALYDEVWTSADATVSNSADEYIPKYTVTFSSNDNTKGTVTAKTGDGTVLSSGDPVKEGTSVIFTAAPKAGNIFMSWTGIDSTATTVTRIIRSDTTVTGNFGAKGYRIAYIDNTNNNKPKWEGDMRELPNGTYITNSGMDEKTTFTIKRNSDSKYTSAGAGSGTYWISNLQEKVTPNSWKVKNSMTATTDYYYVNRKDSPYIVYDPATDQVWLTADKDDLYDVTVVAKDGTIRDDYATSSNFGNTTISMISPNAFTDLSSGYDYNNDSYQVNDVAETGRAEYLKIPAEDVRKGVTIKVATQVNDTYRAEGFYVKGFAVSGVEESYSVLWQEFDDKGNELANYDDKDWIDRGYNEFELTIEGYPDKAIEITPIYFKKETKSGDNVRFYVDGFAGDVYDEWGGTLSVDVYDTSNTHIYGAYPGQLMINYNGRYIMDFPRENIKGLTLNSYVWDMVHCHYFCNDSTADNYQTYDFNDFVYIKDLLEHDSDPNNNDEDIIFSFRHRNDSNHNTKETSQLGKSTYYVNSDNPSATRDYDYRNGFNTINPNDSIYQWESLTDFYGNRIDIFNDYVDTVDTEGHSTNDKAAYTNPIRIVSNGYDYDKAGNYATAWAVYAPLDASGKLAPNGAYDHYGLVDVFGGQGRNDYDSSSYLLNSTHFKNLRWKYDQEYNNAHSTETPAATFVFDLAKMPTVISYEFQVKDGHSNLNLEGSSGDGEVGIRSDGRWYYSKSDQLLKANVIIEYAEKDDNSLYHRDYFQANGVDYTSGSAYVPTVNTGLATGIKAYFDNDDADTAGTTSYSNTPGNTQAYAVSDGEHTFNLTTVGDPNGDYTFKGWYLYSNGKYSLVSRDAIYPSEATANDVYVARYYKTPSGTLNVTHELHPDSTGKGTCYAKVEVMNGDTVKYTYNETTNPIKVTNTYMKSDSTNTLRITLRTVPGSLSTFEDFYKKLSNTIEVLSMSGVLAGVSIDKTNSQNLKATITTNAISNFFTDGEQTVKALPFYSKLNKQEYNYTIEYVYTSRLWGTQEYVQKGTIEDDILKYFDLSSDGSTCVLNDKLQEEFLSMMAPYENNFKEKVVWMFSDNSETPPTEKWHNGELTIRVNSYRPAESKTFTNYYSLPYSTKLGNDQLVASDTDLSGRPIKDNTVPDKEFDATYGKRYTLDNVDSSENFIKAEPIINKGTDDSPNLEYFQYWNVYSADGSNKLIRKCYYNEFNLTFYEAYRIEAVYSSTPTTPSSQSKTDKIQASISFLENSRNQWNYNHGGTVDTVKSYWKLYGDRVFSDFALSFSYDDKMIKTVKNSKLKTQLVIEQLDNLSEKDAETGELDTKKNLPTPANDGKDDLKTYIDNNTNANNHKYIVQNIDKTELDNKNCIEYYYNFANVTQKNMTLDEYNGIKSTFVPTATDLRNHYYRAYAVITDGKDTVVSEPVYFTIYDMANIKNYSENAKADGGKS